MGPKVNRGMTTTQAEEAEGHVCLTEPEAKVGVVHLMLMPETSSPKSTGPVNQGGELGADDLIK